MDEIDRKVRAETNRLVLARTRVKVIIVAIEAGRGDVPEKMTRAQLRTEGARQRLPSSATYRTNRTTLPASLRT